MAAGPGPSRWIGCALVGNKKWDGIAQLVSHHHHSGVVVIRVLFFTWSWHQAVMSANEELVQSRAT